MILELHNLVALQNRNLEIDALESRLKKIPAEITALQQEVATERANLESAEDRLSESQKSRRALEGELKSIEDKIEKYKDQLMQVKSNEEYSAMQKQIQSAKREVSVHEDMILARLDEADRLQEEVEARAKELKEGLAKVGELEAELQSEATRIRTELEVRYEQRKELEQSLPKDLLEQYKRISRNRSGIAVAEAKDEHCQECHVRLRPQVYNEIRVGDRIISCDSCSRILYYESQEQSSDTNHTSSGNEQSSGE
jgi:predicted  nucleic acid-binding Zn-ribbon protein